MLDIQNSVTSWLPAATPTALLLISSEALQLDPEFPLYETYAFHTEDPFAISCPHITQTFVPSDVKMCGNELVPFRAEFISAGAVQLPPLLVVEVT